MYVHVTYENMFYFLHANVKQYFIKSFFMKHTRVHYTVYILDDNIETQCCNENKEQGKNEMEIINVVAITFVYI